MPAQVQSCHNLRLFQPSQKLKNLKQSYERKQPIRYTGTERRRLQPLPRDFKYLIYWPWFAASVIVCVVGAFIYLRYQTPVYNVGAFCFPLPAAAALPRLFPPRCIRKEGGVSLRGQATRLLPSLDIF